ncbi:MAG TPA: hypothetical protein VJP78_01620, partial [Thermoleophilia bacterium]|nr:hypothetical protein [Thermoleophilia bacterium]
MKRITRDREKFGGIDILYELGLAGAVAVRVPDDVDIVARRVADLLRRFADNPALLHGRHVESMFAYVASSLGQIAAIKQEDAGELHAVTDDVQPPDYRIMLKGGYEFLVEVKNFYKKNPMAPLPIKEPYIQKPAKYAELFKRDLKLAVYWARLGVWTLTSVDTMLFQNGKCSLSFREAAKITEMHLLGDHMIGTTPPLTLRLSADPSKSRSDQAVGVVGFTIRSANLYCSETVIDDPLERNLAWYFIRYSSWPVSKSQPVFENGQLVHLGFIARPSETVPDQGFELFGWMSEMISRHYLALTMSDEGQEIERLLPSTHLDPGSLGVLVPDDYRGKSLRLWRFFTDPKSNTSFAFFA